MDMPALDVLASLLFSETSPLYKRLVLEERKVRSLEGGAADSRDPKLFSVQASLVDKVDLQGVKDAIVSAIEGVKQRGVDPVLLAKTKSHLKYGFARRIDNPSSIAAAISNYIAKGQARLAWGDRLKPQRSPAVACTDWLAVCSSGTPKTSDWIQSDRRRELNA